MLIHREYKGSVEDTNLSYIFVNKGLQIIWNV